jgi:hypothetical protein
VWEVMRQHADFRTEFRPEASANLRSRRSTGLQSTNGTSDDNPSPIEVEQTTEAPLVVTSEAPSVSSTESDDSATTQPPQAPFQAPKFEYVFPSRSRYVLVLDRSHLMARKVNMQILFKFSEQISANNLNISGVYVQMLTKFIQIDSS